MGAGGKRSCVELAPGVVAGDRLRRGRMVAGRASIGQLVRMLDAHVERAPSLDDAQCADLAGAVQRLATALRGRAQDLI